ncbi:hypothetical protein PHISP_02015 [Aspergillus sp. HF37]|nr:hypothetical protein PHISP_02015 [Aspergillus sp. HF37]
MAIMARITDMTITTLEAEATMMLDMATMANIPRRDLVEHPARNRDLMDVVLPWSPRMTRAMDTMVGRHRMGLMVAAALQGDLPQKGIA